MKQYPAFIIDRSRRSAASRYADDFIACADQECAFVARAYKVPKSQQEEHLEALRSSGVSFSYKFFGDALIVVEIVKFLHDSPNMERVPSLLNRALKTYVFREARAVHRDGAPYDDQIAALDDVLRMVEAQRPTLVDLNGAKATKAFTNALRGARDSVALLQEMIKRHE